MHEKCSAASLLLSITSISSSRVVSSSPFTLRADPCEGVECPTNQVCQLDDNRNPICRCNAICSLDLKPVCGSNGMSRDHRRESFAERLMTLSCRATARLFSLPGKTYTNECILRVEACKAKKSLRILYNGECGSGRGT